MYIDLNKLYSDKRTGVDKSTSDKTDPRTEFQRDFDRIIFSSAFRRLQNKTQVFPLPGSVFVHNRLTHSLEVASVGRSLGTQIGEFIIKEYEKDLTNESKDFYKNNLHNVISSACLCHDIGNPAFGHSGEDAIATYFKKNENELKVLFSKPQWEDLINFEGNANAIRILTHQQKGKSKGGLRLTYSTLSAIAKYPCESIGKDKDFIHRKKFGFFQSEKKTFIDIADNTQMIKDDSTPLVYFRHPFVWLVEAADDICYNIIDYEDAHRLKIVEHQKCVDQLIYLIECIGNNDINRVKRVLDGITDKNERISYLRAKSINSLITQAKEIYQTNFENILMGKHKKSLFDEISETCDGLNGIIEFSGEYIYNHRSVVEIENAGYNVMYELLSHFIPPILQEKSELTQADKKAIRLIPPSFNYDTDDSYDKVLGVLEYVSGMTDNYAAELYKRIRGIKIGMRI